MYKTGALLKEEVIDYWMKYMRNTRYISSNCPELPNMLLNNPKKYSDGTADAWIYQDNHWIDLYTKPGKLLYSYRGNTLVNNEIKFSTKDLLYELDIKDDILEAGLIRDDDPILLNISG
jgi:hypothetical protein